MGRYPRKNKTVSSIITSSVRRGPDSGQPPIVEPKPVSPAVVDAINEPMTSKSDENDSAMKYFGEVNQKTAENLEKGRKEKKERDEKNAREELIGLLRSVFPEDCKKDDKGQIVTKEELIERFLNVRPDTYKFLLQRRRQKKNLRDEVEIFFNDAYDSGELSGGESEKNRIREYLLGRHIDRWNNLRAKIQQAKNIEGILEITRERDFPVIEWDFVDRDPEYIRTLLKEIEKNPSVQNIRKLPRTFDLQKKVVELTPSLTEEEKKYLGFSEKKVDSSVNAGGVATDAQSRSVADGVVTTDLGQKDSSDVDWDSVQKDFDEEGKKILEERARSIKFNRLDTQKAFDEESEQLKNRDRLAERFHDIKNFDELLILLNDPEFPGIQGSGQFYSGEMLREIVEDARKTGNTRFVTRSHGFLETIERLLRQEKVGVVSENVPEIIFEENTKDAPVVSTIENKNKVEKRGETFDAAISDDLKELYGKAIDLQKACDEAGRLYAEAQGREDSLRTKVYRIFPRLREKLARELEGKKSIVELEQEYRQRLAELRQIKIDIANREAVKQGDAGKDIGKKMAEALVENNFREGVRMAELWAGEKRGDRRRMKVIRMAEDAVERYRKLDPKVKIAFSGILFAGTVVAGGVNWPLFVAALFPRIFGSAGLASAGKQLHEKYALGKLGKASGVERSQGWNEEALRQQANVPLEKFALYRRESRRRSRAWAGGGIALFLMGTGASYAGLAHTAEHVADGENAVGAVQKVLGANSGAGAVAKGAVEIPTGQGDATKEMLAAAKKLVTEGQQEHVSTPFGTAEVLAQKPSGVGGFVSNADMAGTGVMDHGVAAEVAGKIGEGEIREVIVGNHSSILGAMNTMGTDGGDNYRAYLEFLEKMKAQGENTVKLDKLLQGKTFPGDRVYIETGIDGKPHILGIERESGGASLWKKFVKGFEETVRQKVELGNQSVSEIHPFTEATLPRDPLSKVPVPSLEDTLKGNIQLDTVSPAPNIETASATTTIPLGTTPEDVLSKALPPEPSIIQESQNILQENLYAPLNRYQELLPYFHGVFDHILISNPEKIALQNIFLAGESLNGRPPTTALIEKTQEKLFGVLFSGKEMAAVINESTSTIPMQFGSDSAAMRHFEAAYGALKSGYFEGQKLAVSDKPIGEWLRDVTVYILRNPIRFE